MTKPKHLTEEALLELAGERLSAEDRRAAEEHLSECKACLKHYQDLKFAHTVFERMAEVGLQEVLPAPVRRPAVRPRREAAFPWGPVGAITVTCICVITFLLYPRAVPTVSASELLSSAITSESQPTLAVGFRVKSGGQICAGGKQSEQLVSFERSVKCNRALQHMKATPWSHGNPLSAKTYAAWRDSLHKHQDQVAKREASWEIKTTTDEEPVRTASLEMRTSDYHTTKLTLDFEDDDELSISEDTEPLAPPTTEVATNTVPQMSLHLDNPADQLEVEAWTALQRMNADSGWEAIVIRSGSHVEVKAVVDGDDRKRQLLEGFAAHPAVDLDIHLSPDPDDYRDLSPVRPHPLGDSPGLAATWLQQQFPETDARTVFTNTALHLSHQILGRTFFIDRLQQRQRALTHCSCARELSSLVETEKQALAKLQTDLSLGIEPLIGPPAHSRPHPMTLAEAKNLDGDLAELLWAGAGEDQSSFDDRVHEVRKLLSRQR